jgi:DNA invertase Pin-like site-specific DNA recombinase
VQLHDYCNASGWTVSNEYIDQVSGTTSERDAFKRLFEDASRRPFDIVLVRALNRFTRECVLETFEQFDA